MVRAEGEKQANSTQPANSAQSEANAKESASLGNAETLVSPQEQWNKFFPRSQVPPEQLEYLQRSRM
jgi:hypothetical protein